MVESLPALQETWVQSLGRGGGGPLEKGMATTPVLLPGEFHGQGSLEGYSPKESDTTERPTHTHTHTHTHPPLQGI